MTGKKKEKLGIFFMLETFILISQKSSIAARKAILGGGNAEYCYKSNIGVQFNVLYIININC